MTDAVRTEIARGVATLTLDRPDNRNALSIELMNALGDALDAAMSDDDVRLVVLTNEATTFCAGANLGPEPTDEPARHGLVDIFGKMLDGPKPVVGRIAGHCMGGGVGLAAGCDISLVADDARFGFTEVRIGVAPAIISVVVLPKMRRADALELFLSGERIDAARAAEVGLVNRTVPRDRLDEATDEVVGKLLAGGPNALAAAKRLVYEVPAMRRADAFAMTAELSANLFRSEEAAEGIAAFREKRDASWLP